MTNDQLLGRAFLALCAITFITLCNTAVFFNFYPYLLTRGFSSSEAGLLIGLYPLTSMVMYGGLSRFITLDNAYGVMTLGLVMTIACSSAYLVADTMLPLAMIRIASGAAMFCAMASCMTLFIAVIPPGKTGFAFSLYSVAMLLPYSIMPAVTELLSGLITSPPVMYMLTALMLLPAVGFSGLRSLRRKEGGAGDSRQADERPTGAAYRRNLLRKPVAAILFLNGAYFFLFASLFYFLKGYGTQLGISKPGYFFTIQMGIMVLLRLFGSTIFDRFSKHYLILSAFLVTGLGYGVLAVGVFGWAFFATAVLFGAGMGLCIPPLNALLYHHGEPQFRGYNANMMLLVMHGGSFLGPSGGSLLIAAGGYPAYCMGAIALTLAASLVIFALKQSTQAEKNAPA